MSAALLILSNFVLILVGLALARRFAYGREFWEGVEKLVYYVGTVLSMATLPAWMALPL